MQPLRMPKWKAQQCRAAWQAAAGAAHSRARRQRQLLAHILPAAPQHHAAQHAPACAAARVRRGALHGRSTLCVAPGSTAMVLGVPADGGERGAFLLAHQQPHQCEAANSVLPRHAPLPRASRRPTSAPAGPRACAFRTAPAPLPSTGQRGTEAPAPGTRTCASHVQGARACRRGQAHG